MDYQKEKRTGGKPCRENLPGDVFFTLFFTESGERMGREWHWTEKEKGFSD